MTALASTPPSDLTPATSNEMKVPVRGGRYVIGLFPVNRDFDAGEWLELRDPKGRVICRQNWIGVYGVGFAPPVYDLAPGEYRIVPSPGFYGAYSYSFIRK